jgi:hypothetical protein
MDLSVSFTAGVQPILSVMPDGGTTKNYTLINLSFRNQAEHLLDSRRYEAEMQMLFRAGDTGSYSYSMMSVFLNNIDSTVNINLIGANYMNLN